MNVSPADPAGSSPLIEALAAMPAAHEPTPAAESFRSLLREAEAEEVAPDASHPNSILASEERQVAREDVDKTTETQTAADEDSPTAAEDSIEEAIAIVVPMAPFQPLPSLADTDEAAADVASADDLTATGSIEAATTVQPPSPITVPIEARDGDDAGELPEALRPESPAAVVGEFAQPIDLTLATPEPGEAPPTFEAAESLADEPMPDKPHPADGEHQHSDETNDLAQSAVEGSAVKTELPAAMSQPADPVGARTDHLPVAERPPPATAVVSLAPAPVLAPVLPPELAAEQGGRNEGEGQVASADTVRLLTRVARAFHFAQDGGEVRIRLSPPELGALRMEVRVLEGALVARLETETAAARTAIIENLPALRERLADQGVRIERFDVDLMQRHAGGSPDRPTDRQPPEPQPPSPAPRPRRMPQVAEGVVARHLIAADSSAGRLNVIV